MKTWTGTEMERARQGLEHASATVLGHILFEFSRLDMALGLFLVWTDSGSQLETLTKTVSEDSFNKKLSFLQDLVRQKYADEQEASSFYTQWIEDAHSVRINRNEFVHGRWGIDHMNNQVVNVIGLPTSPDQVAKHYTILELKAFLERMKHLQTRLSELRDRWPV